MFPIPVNKLDCLYQGKLKPGLHMKDVGLLGAVHAARVSMEHGHSKASSSCFKTCSRVASVSGDEAQSSVSPASFFLEGARRVRHGIFDACFCLRFTLLTATPIAGSAPGFPSPRRPVPEPPQPFSRRRPVHSHLTDRRGLPHPARASLRPSTR